MRHLNTLHLYHFPPDRPESLLPLPGELGLARWLVLPQLAPPHHRPQGRSSSQVLQERGAP